MDKERNNFFIREKRSIWLKSYLICFGCKLVNVFKNLNFNEEFEKLENEKNMKFF